MPRSPEEKMLRRQHTQMPPITLNHMGRGLSRQIAIKKQPRRCPCSLGEAAGVPGVPYLEERGRNRRTKDHFVGARPIPYLTIPSTVLRHITTRRLSSSQTPRCPPRILTQPLKQMRGHWPRAYHKPLILHERTPRVSRPTATTQ